MAEKAMMQHATGRKKDCGMSAIDLPVNLEGWARRTVAEAPISEVEFGENLPRIGRVGRNYGFESLRELFVQMTSAGLAFAEVLKLLERGDVPLVMKPDMERDAARHS